MIGLPPAAFDHALDVRRDQRPPSEHAEVDGLEVGEERVVALDREHGLPGLDAVAVIERVHRQRVPVVRAELEHGDRLVDAAEHRLLALEDLHHDARPPAVGEQRVARVVEVRVGVVALAHLLDREVEDLRREPLSRPFASSPSSPAPDRLRARPRRPRAARATARRSRSGACSSWPGRASAFASGWPGCRVIQPKTSTAAPTAATEPAMRAGPRTDLGARAASTLPTAEAASSGPIRCEPQRSCSFARFSPCS